MDILQYQYLTSIESPEQMLNYVSAFAVAQGWSVVEWRPDCDWSGGWTTGSGTYLELSSPGYGSQALRYRFFIDYHTVQNMWLYVACARPDDPEYDTSGTYSPVAQTDHSWWQSQSDDDSIPFPARISLPPGRIPSMWIWGDETLIIVIIQTDAILYDSFAFGSPQLFSEFRSQTQLMGLWVGKDSWADVSREHYWYNFSTDSKWRAWFWCFAALATTGAENYWQSAWFNNIYWDDRPMGSNYPGALMEYAVSLTIWRTGGTYGNFTYTEGGHYPVPKNVVTLNTFSDKRVGISPVVFVRNYTGSHPSEPWYPVGTLPFVYIPWSGLSPGEIVTYGLDKYRVFPMNSYLDDYGVALRYE